MMRKKPHRSTTHQSWLLLLLALTLAFACTKHPTAPASETASETASKTTTPETTAKDTATLPAQDFCKAYATKACAWQQRCSPSSHVEGCEKTLSATCDELLTPYALAAMERGSINYNPAVAASWLNTLSELPCDSDDIILAPEPFFR